MFFQTSLTPLTMQDQKDQPTTSEQEEQVVVEHVEEGEESAEEEEIPTAVPQNAKNDVQKMLKDILKAQGLELDAEAMKLLESNSAAEFEKIFLEKAAGHAAKKGKKKATK